MTVVKDSPLSYSISEFVNHYWPGVIVCCNIVQSTRKDLAEHLVAAHSNASQSLALAKAPSTTPVTVDDLDSLLVSDVPPLPPAPKPISKTTSLRRIRPLVADQSSKPPIVVDLSSTPVKPVAKKVSSKTNSHRSVVDLWSSSPSTRNLREQANNKRPRSKSPSRSPSPFHVSPISSPPPSSSRITRNTTNKNHYKSPSRRSTSPSFPLDFSLSPLLPTFSSPPPSTRNEGTCGRSSSPFPSPPDIFNQPTTAISIQSRSTASGLTRQIYFKLLHLLINYLSIAGSLAVVSSEQNGSSSSSSQQQQLTQQQNNDEPTALFCSSLSTMLSHLQPYQRERIKRDIYNLVSDALLVELPTPH